MCATANTLHTGLLCVQQPTHSLAVLFEGSDLGTPFFHNSALQSVGLVLTDALLNQQTQVIHSAQQGPEPATLNLP